MKNLYTANDLKREVLTEEISFRHSFRRDNARLIHSPVFRRLQGKTQLFPGYEADFFRNRLTHSLEVAQIAKGIAERINSEHDYFKEHPIDLSLVETAALAHDLGHPPFGHNGEKALDHCMREHGGFEGNAQTLRILSRLEKKSTYSEHKVFNPILDGEDNRCGLNLTYRTLGSILKYDKKIPLNREKGSEVNKGYYYTESDIVDRIKKNVAGKKDLAFKTIECSIMDVADDIAYSTYDLEDAFKAGFLSPLKMLTPSAEILKRVAKKVRDRLSIPGFNADTALLILHREYGGLLNPDAHESLSAAILSKDPGAIESIFRNVAVISSNLSELICEDGYYRTSYTSEVIHKLIMSIEVEYDERKPALSLVRLCEDERIKVEVLKNFTYETIIISPRLSIVEQRGFEIVETIFNALTEDNHRAGYNLLPKDFRILFDGFTDNHLKKRVICDFIAGMTDRYAVEFFSRLKSENPQTIFKPF